MPYRQQVMFLAGAVVVLAFRMASIVKVCVWIKVPGCVQFSGVGSIPFYEQSFYDNLHDGTCKVGVQYGFVYMHMIFIVLLNINHFPNTHHQPPKKRGDVIDTILPYLCRASELLSLKHLPQPSCSQTCGFSPECVRMCTLRADRYIKRYTCQYH